MSPEIIDIDNNSLCQLCEKRWRTGLGDFTFDGKNGNTPPFSTGTEGAAFPMTGPGGQRFYAKFFRRFQYPSLRYKRIEWLIQQKVFQWSLALSPAPRLWLDSRKIGRPDGIYFDITACVSQAAPGESWGLVKENIQSGNWKPVDRDWRIKSAIVLLSAMEQFDKNKFVHGDLSENNLFLNTSGDGQPLISVIDFDAFAVVGRPDFSLSLDRGGTCGTEGYCPPILLERKSAGDLSVAPVSDRYARDMLLLELLCFNDNFMPRGNKLTALPPAQWSNDQWASARKILAATLARCPAELQSTLKHLLCPNILTLDEEHRPATTAIFSVGHPAPAALPPRLAPVAVIKPQVAVVNAANTPQNAIAPAAVNRQAAAASAAPPGGSTNGTLTSNRPATTAASPSGIRQSPGNGPPNRFATPLKVPPTAAPIPAPLPAPVPAAVAHQPPLPATANPQRVPAGIQQPVMPVVTATNHLSPNMITPRPLPAGNIPAVPGQAGAPQAVTPGAPPSINAYIGCIASFFSGCLTVIFATMAFSVLSTLIIAIALNKKTNGAPLGLTFNDRRTIYVLCTTLCFAFLAIKILSWSRRVIRSGGGLLQAPNKIAGAVRNVCRNPRPVLDWIVQTSRKLRLKEFLLLAAMILLAIIAAAGKNSRNNK